MLTNQKYKALLLSRTSPGAGPSDGDAQRNTRSGRVFSSPDRPGYIRIDDGPPTRESPCKYTLMPLSQVVGYKGGKQQRCMICNELCSWVCARCTKGPCKLFPLHPPVSQSKRKFGCLVAHRRDPTDTYRKTVEAVSGISKKSKHMRRVPVVTV